MTNQSWAELEALVSEQRGALESIRAVMPYDHCHSCPEFIRKTDKALSLTQSHPRILAISKVLGAASAHYCPLGQNMTCGICVALAEYDRAGG